MPTVSGHQHGSFQQITASYRQRIVVIELSLEKDTQDMDPYFIETTTCPSLGSNGAPRDPLNGMIGFL